MLYLAFVALALLAVLLSFEYPNQYRIGRGRWERWQFIQTKASALSVNNDVSLTLTVARTCYAIGWKAYAKVAPTGANITGTIQYKRGVGAWTTIATITIVAGANAGSGALATSVALLDDDILRLNITQVGSVIAGEDLTAQLIIME